MKKIIITSLLILYCFVYAAKAQILTPVKWSYGAKKLSKTEAVIFLKATIDDDWHLYSQTVPDGGPVKTSFSFDHSKAYTLVGTTQEPKPISRFEQVFGIKVSFFEKEVIFQQKIKLNANGPVTVKGSLEYMTCNDEKCLPPEDISFAIPIK